MCETTLCILVKHDKLLLAMKKRGFGQGRWNGVGGKVKDGESVQTAALREMKEEIGVRVREQDLVPMAILDFYFNHRPEWNQRVNVFLVNVWKGNPRETEEMRPEWFCTDQLPFHAMWPDDPYWLPLILTGKKVSGVFHFKDDGNNFDHFEVKEV